MFQNTMPFIPKIDNRRNRFNVGVEVPKNAVNVAHYYVPPLDSNENIIIGDNSNFIIENMNQPQESIMYVDTDNILKNESNGILSDPNIDSELVAVTDKFSDDIPLYYKHKLKYLHYDRAASLDGTYYGDSISLKDTQGNDLPASYKWKAILKGVEAPDDADALTKKKYSCLYEITLYTSFQIEDNFQVKCIYNAIAIDDTDSSVNTIPHYEELIAPQTFFSKADSILEAITEDNKYYIQKSSTTIKSSIMYAKGVFTDPRNPQKIKLNIEVEYEPIGSVPAVVTLTVPNEIEILNRDSAMGIEIDMYIGRKQKIFDKTIREILNTSGIVPSSFYNRNIISVKLDVVYCDRDREAITILTRPDGNGFVLAETSLNTGYISNIPDKHFREKNNKILTGYSIKFKDRNPIKLLPPRELNSLDNWYIRIQNGRFVKENAFGKCHFFLPEYYTQHYDDEYGFPYKKITKEIPTLVGVKSIKIKNAPLFVTTNNLGQPDNLTIYRIDAYGNKWRININSWNDKDGIINLTDFVSDNDEIYVDYVFEEQSYVYRGYNKLSTKQILHHILLDLNPNKHHMMTNVTTGLTENEVTDVPSFQLIDKVVYVYMKPAIIEKGPGNYEYNDKVLHHTLYQLTDTELLEQNLLLIGSIYVRPNSSFYSLQVTDTRTRGGGILEEISNDLRKELEPDSDFYWDIGYWDGEAYSENAVIVVRLDRKLLKQFGGRFTEDEIETAVNKHIAFGTLAIIEYVTVFEDGNFSIQNLDINVQPTNKLNYKPSMMLSLDLDIDVSIMDMSIYEHTIMKPTAEFEVCINKPIVDIVSLSTGIDKPNVFLLEELKVKSGEIIDITCKSTLEAGFKVEATVSIEETTLTTPTVSLVIDNNDGSKITKPSYVDIIAE